MTFEQSQTGRGINDMKHSFTLLSIMVSRTAIQRVFHIDPPYKLGSENLNKTIQLDHT